MNGGISGVKGIANEARLLFRDQSRIGGVKETGQGGWRACGSGGCPGGGQV